MNTNIIQSKYPMIEMNQAYEILKNYFLSLNKDIIEIDLLKSLNYISSEDVYSKINLPTINTSMMDGYGINIDEINNNILEVVNSIYAGENFSEYKEMNNKCIYVTTGSSLPKNINCVIPIEKVEQIEYNKFIKLLDLNFKEFSYIRKVGSDLKENEKLIDKYEKIGFSEINLCSSCGIIKVKVFRPPRIGILSSGNEINDISNHNHNGIVDTNRISIKFILNKFFPHLDLIDYGIVKDEITEIRNTFNRAVRENIDLLITSGGVSMGEKDLIKKFLEKEGNISFGRLNMKPGKPTTFGNYNNLAVIGLPGNPVSFTVCSYLLVTYIINLFQNFDKFPFNLYSAKLLNDHKIDNERPEYSRGILYFNKADSKFYVETTGNQQSSRIKSFKDSNCLICFKTEKYEIVDCYLLTDLILIDKTFQSQKKFTVSSITLSDRASQGLYEEDKSTKTIFDYYTKNSFYNLISQIVIPDDKNKLIESFDKLVSLNCDLILTTGGTGLSPRDITSEVTKKYIDKEATGLSSLLMFESLKFTKFACLSNPVVGVKKNSLIINLPGSPKAIIENLSIIEAVLPHALNQINKSIDFH